MGSGIRLPLLPLQRPVAMEAGAAAPLRGGVSAAAANSFLLQLAVERLGLVLKSGVRSKDFFQFCFSVARGIDYALANNNIPAAALRLPSFVKEVYKHRNNSSLQSAIMVLMISVKNACKNGWFQIADADELLSMTNELYSSFCTSITKEASNALDTISKVISRFYPQLRLCRVIVSLEAKPGYDILMADFQIVKNVSPEERIRLFVAQTDNLETSSCIISPPQVSFLVNGKGVERRIDVSLDHGPQHPTDITKMLKYGTNLIQAVGYFSGNCIIAIAFMSNLTSIAPILKDFVQPAISALDPDSEIIEGPSRVSLNCPISLKRIKTPIKGHLCKHHQCFDYENFVEMNSRTPLWRCPWCNQPASYIDLCIDQNMVKILSKTGEDVADVIIFADGSLKAVADRDRSTNQLHDETVAVLNFGCESNRFANTLANVIDLTIEDNGESDILNGSLKWVGEIEDTKPFKDVPVFPVSESSSASPLGSCMAVTTQATTDQMGNNTWLRNWSSTSSFNGSRISTALLDSQIDETLASLVPNFVLNPVITDAVSPALNRELAASHEFFQPTLQSISQVRQDNMHAQELHFGNSAMGTVTERPLIPRTVTRTPIAVPALPIQSQVTGSTQRTQTNVVPFNITTSVNPSTVFGTIPTVRAIPDGFSAMSNDFQVQQVSGTLNVVSPSQQLHSITQIQGHEERHNIILNPAFQQVVRLPALDQVSMRTLVDQQTRLGAYRAHPQPLSDIWNSHHQLRSLRTHQSMSHCTDILPQSSCIPSVQACQASLNATVTSSGSLSNEWNQLLDAHRAMQTRPHSGIVLPCTSRSGLSFQAAAGGFRWASNEQLQNSFGGLQAVAGFNSFTESPSELNWQPMGWMRGSLTGEAYSAALRHYAAQPTQQVPARLSTASTDQHLC